MHVQLEQRVPLSTEVLEASTDQVLRATLATVVPSLRLTSMLLRQSTLLGQCRKPQPYL